MQLPAWNENEKKKRKKPSQLVMNTSKDASVVLVNCSCGMFDRRKTLRLLSSPTQCRKFPLTYRGKKKPGIKLTELNC